MKSQLILMCLMTLHVFAELTYSSSDLDFISWKSSEISLRKVTATDVADFVNRKMPNDWYPITPEQIGAYRWVDVDGDKNSELFVTVAESRRILNQLFVFGTFNKQKSLMQKVSVWMLENLDQAIRDIDQDGFFELIVSKDISFAGEGLATPRPIWTAVYRWRNHKFVRADSHYPKLYKGLLPSIQCDIDKLHRDWEETWRGIDTISLDEPAFLLARQQYEGFVALQTIERDKILRLIGSNREAGYTEAVEWTKSTDVTLREYAIVVFWDIRDKKSLHQLALLSQDPDEKVARHAIYALTSANKDVD